MRHITVKRLRQYALIDFRVFEKRHPDVPFKRFFKTAKRLYLRGELKLT